MPINYKGGESVIRVIENKNKVDADKASSGLDNLIDSICKSYSIPPSRVDELKSGLVDIVSSYLNRFLGSLSINESEDNALNIEISELTGDLKSKIEYILNSLRLSEEVVLTQNGGEVIRFKNDPDGITYELTDLDLDLIDIDNLVLAWKCDDLVKVAPLLSDILIGRKEC